MNPIEYADQVKGILQYLPFADIAAVIAALRTARAEGRRIFIMGNGGSGATASHIAADLMKSCGGWGRSFIMCLNDNVAALTAWANDETFQQVFSKQIRKLAAKDDVVIVLSCSGCSGNIVGAIRAGKQAGAVTVALTGASYIEGGPAAQDALISVVVPTDNMEMIEDVHLMIGHMIKTALLQPLAPTS